MPARTHPGTRRVRLPASAPVVVLGGGPAGLTAAWQLARQGQRGAVFEATGRFGGLCRTERWQGYLCDIGGHRFFTAFDEVAAIWQAVLGDDLLTRPRLSRIYFRGRFFDYPLSAGNALANLGMRESARCAASYLAARLTAPWHDEPASFEEWITQRFGRRLFENFFASYTEKVWGVPTTEIAADWASQRIKQLDLGAAVRDALRRSLRPGARAQAHASLISSFRYPRHGPGMLFERMAAQAAEGGASLHLGCTVLGVLHDAGRARAVRVRRADGREHVCAGEHVLSSMPLPELVQALDPPPPPEVLRAAAALSFRHMLVVLLVVERADLFPDNWIYVHDPRLQVGRIQNFKNWSPELVPDPATTSLGLEYFCSGHDALWRTPDAELLALAGREIAATGLLKGARVRGGAVFRAPGAYPVYLTGFQRHLDVVRGFLASLPNLHCVGRGGMFKYNNADHSMLTALLAVENLGGATHDLWAVNTDTAYHEIRPGR